MRIVRPCRVSIDIAGFNNMELNEDVDGAFESETFENSIKWVPLAITHVEYPQGDWFGKILAISSMMPLVILTGFITLILFRRDLHTISFFCGTILNEVINWVLKHTIREMRPCRGRETVYSEYGMPSNHAQFMWFFATYIVFFVTIRVHHVNNSTLIDNAWKIVATVGVIWSAAAVCYGRIYLHYHTWGQITCGAILGSVLACGWFAVMQLVLTPSFPIIASWPLCEYLMIRDSTLIPNVLWFEYTSYRTETRTRHRKLVSMRSQ